jgi:hypothetical protein
VASPTRRAEPGERPRSPVAQTTDATRPSTGRRDARYNCGMAVRHGTIAAALLVCVFVAITASIVEVRRPLDARVSKSFDLALSRLSKMRFVVEPLGCRKQSLDFYSCSAVVQMIPELARLKVEYTLSLYDEDCWSATPTRQTQRPSTLGRVQPQFAGLHGCATG